MQVSTRLPPAQLACYEAAVATSYDERLFIRQMQSPLGTWQRSIQGT